MEFIIRSRPSLRSVHMICDGADHSCENRSMLFAVFDEPVFFNPGPHRNISSDPKPNLLRKSL